MSRLHSGARTGRREHRLQVLAAGKRAWPSGVLRRMTWASVLRRRTAFALLALGGWLLPENAVVEQHGRSIFSVPDPEGRVISPGQEMNGILTEADLLDQHGDPVQVWALEIAPGAKVQVDLLSEAFDAVLRIVGPGLSAGIYDNDSAGDFNSRICFVPESSGDYRIVVSSYTSLGGFTLTVSAVEACTRWRPDSAPALIRYTTLLEQAKSDLAERLDVEPEWIELVSMGPVIWRNGSLGCPLPDMVYTQAMERGWVIRLQVSGGFYQYHSRDRSDPFLCRHPSPHEPLLYGWE